MKKRILFLFLAFFLILGCSPLNAWAAETSGTCGESATWSINEITGVLTISGSGEMADYAATENLPPWQAHQNAIRLVSVGAEITKIGSYAFYDLPNLKRVELYCGAIVIEKAAFAGCANLESVWFDARKPHSGVESIQPGELAKQAAVTLSSEDGVIGEEAFAGCTSLYACDLWAETTAVGKRAFAGCTSLHRVNLRESVQTLGEEAFAGCTALERIILPASLTGLGVGALANCTSLDTVIFSGDAPAFGDEVFSGVTATVHYPGDGAAWTEEILASLGTSVTCHPYTAATEGTCGDNLTWSFREDWGQLTISGTGAMYDYDEGALPPWWALQDEIDYIVIENGITRIGSYAFYGLTGFWRAELYCGPVEIGQGAFQNCVGLGSVWLNTERPDYGEESYDPEVQTKSSAIIPVAGVYSIEEEAFAGCTDLRSWNQWLEGDAIIKERAFADCTLLQIADLGDGIVTIGNRAFENCAYLWKVVAPVGLTYVGEGAFANCKSLTTFVFCGDAPTIADDAFFGATVSAYYPAHNTTWTAETRKDYGGDLAWTAYEPYENPLLSGGTCGENVKWSLDDAGTLTIYGTGAMRDYDQDDWDGPAWRYGEQREEITRVVVIPGVTHLGRGAFSSLTNVVEVSIPNTVTSLGNSVFSGCTSMTSFDLPDSITQMGSYVFSYCNSLAEVNLPASITTIPEYAYYECKGLTDIIIPDTIKEIGRYAFNGCQNLKKVTFSPSVEKICEGAFWYTGLEGVHITSGIREIEPGAFTFTENNAGFTVDAENPCFSADEQGVLYNKDKTVLVQAPDTLSGTYTLVSTTREIAAGAFASNVNLEGVVLPQGLVTIGDHAFVQCSKLGEVNFPASLTVIGERAFSGCDSITKVTLPAGLNTLGSGAFAGCTSLAEIHIPAGITRLEDSVFASTAIREIKLPPNLTYIGAEVFYNCEQLESFTIPQTVTELGEGIFTFCENLKEITVPGTVTEIPRDFCNYSGVERVNIAYGTTVIGEYAFSSCDNLREITIPGSVQTIGHAAFNNCEKLEKAVLEEGTVTVSSHVFQGCRALTQVQLPSTLKTIGYDAFAMTSLGSVELPEGLETIGDYAFFASNISHFIIPSTVTYIGRWSLDCANSYIFFLGDMPQMDTAFTENKYVVCFYPDGNETWSAEARAPYSALKWKSYNGETMCYEGTVNSNISWALHLPTSTLTVSGEGAMTDYGAEGYAPWNDMKASIRHVVVDEGITHVGAYAFMRTYSLETVTLADTVTSIGKFAFDVCEHLEKADLGEKMQVIGFAAFSNTGLQEIALPDTVTTLEQAAFSDCEFLEVVYIPAATTTIGPYVFSDCARLTAIRVHRDNPAYCSDLRGVLYNRDKTRLVYAPDALTGRYEISSRVNTIDENAFRYCVNLTDLVVDQRNPAYQSGSRGELLSKDGKILYWAPAALGGSYEVPYGVETIKGYTFYGNLSLTDLVLPNTVKTVEKYAFYDCENLQTLKVGTGISHFGEQCFGSTGLHTVTFAGNQPTHDNWPFSNVTATVYYPEGNDTWATPDQNGWYAELTYVPYTPAKTGIYEENGLYYYYEDGEIQYGAGLVCLDGDYYYIRSGGYAAVGEYWATYTNDLLPQRMYNFGTDGKLIFGKHGVVEEDGGYYYYFANVLQPGAGLIVWEGDYYYVRSSGKVATGNYWPTSTNGLLPERMYNFGTDGKLVWGRHGIVEENGGLYYYFADVLQPGAGLILWENDYYYIRSSGQAAAGNYWVTNTNDLLPEWMYTFGADGRLDLGKHGIVKENGGYYYYFANALRPGAGLIELDGDYYYIRSNGQAATGKYWVTITNGLMEEGYYTFGEDGKMIR